MYLHIFFSQALRSSDKTFPGRGRLEGKNFDNNSFIEIVYIFFFFGHGNCIHSMGRVTDKTIIQHQNQTCSFWNFIGQTVSKRSRSRSRSGSTAPPAITIPIACSPQ